MLTFRSSSYRLGDCFILGLQTFRTVLGLYYFKNKMLYFVVVGTNDFRLIIIIKNVKKKRKIKIIKKTAESPMSLSWK